VYVFWAVTGWIRSDPSWRKYGVESRQNCQRQRSGRRGGSPACRPAPFPHPCRRGRATRSLARNEGVARRVGPRGVSPSGTVRTVTVIGGALTPEAAGPDFFPSIARNHSGRQGMLRVTRFIQ
jgi:hypothetical protein